MKNSLFMATVLLLGAGVPLLCQAGQGDAMPGMASQGIVRLPSSGMVEQTFDRLRGQSSQPPHSRSFKWTSPRIDTNPRETPTAKPSFPAIDEQLDNASQVHPSGHYLTR
ncbi:MAG: hypothetical protein NPIRA01_25760 [Nitrospirales bacterium]|nr:MAG: hypothetical protein NPIRA01_25760 [Nitrospirales bacterium]